MSEREHTFRTLGDATALLQSGPGTIQEGDVILLRGFGDNEDLRLRVDKIHPNFVMDVSNFGA
jgi:hypothetical protein